jgi:protein-disulfide isomerase
MHRLCRLSAATLAAAIPFAPALHAQTSVPPNKAQHFKDTSILKPPAGQKVAIVEFEDLECPACAHAFPFVHQALNHYHLAFVRHDFQIPGHIWSHDAAIYARYMEAKFGVEYATDYRRQVFASQYRISSKDDLKAFTDKYLKEHGNNSLPFAMDPKLGEAVDADTELGRKLGLDHTPTIVVVTPDHWIDVEDIDQLYTAIDQAQAEAGVAKPAAAAHRTAAHK